jgi:GNAT superfamily N-acetyltransferase
MAIDVRMIDPYDDAARADHLAIAVAVREHDVPDFPPPCPVRFAGQLRFPEKAMESVAFTAYLDGTPAGTLSMWFPQLDNVGNARLDLQVHPALRRRGVGRALYDFAVAQARQRGRVRTISDSVATLPGGTPRDESGGGFAAAMGAHRALVDVRRRLDLSTVDVDELPMPQAPGYSVVTWRDRAPDEFLADLGRLDGRMALDAPMGDLVVEPWKVDAERIRDGERCAAARGDRLYHTGIRHDESGTLAAWTTLAFEATLPWHAWQYITIVDPDHRGHRLGTWVKVANLRWTLEHEPELRIIDTWNAAVNKHMIAINEAIGFRAVDEWHQWQHEIGTGSD